MSSEQFESGYYWVRRPFIGWEIAYYSETSKAFFRIAENKFYEPSHFEEIDPSPIIRKPNDT